MSFENKIKRWVELDNRVRKHKEEIKVLNSEKNVMTDDILNYVETQQLEHATIQITDGSLSFKSNKQTKPLTFKFLKQCLNECISDEGKVDQLIEYIKQKREVKYVKDIRRFYTS